MFLSPRPPLTSKITVLRARSSRGAWEGRLDGLLCSCNAWEKKRILVVLLLAERAPSEGPRSTRAFEDQPGHPLKREPSKLGGKGRSRQTILLARRTRTIRQCSSDARTEGQSGDSFGGDAEQRRPSPGLMARLGVPVGGRVRKSRAVGDHLARPQGGGEIGGDTASARFSSTCSTHIPVAPLSTARRNYAKKSGPKAEKSLPGATILPGANSESCK